MNKPLKDTQEKQEKQEKAIKQVRETVQDLKNEMEVMKKTQTKGRVEMENLGKQTGTTETSITNRIQEIEERISDTGDSTEKINAENLSQKAKNKSKNKQNRG